MTQILADPFLLIKLLKGCPLSVFHALLLARITGQGAASAGWLARQTGYSDKPVSQALETLEQYGLACRGERNGWQATDAALRLLPGAAAPATEPARSAQLAPTPAPQELPEPESFRPSNTSSMNLSRIQMVNNQLVVARANPAAAAAASGVEKSPPESLSQSNYAALEESGIHEPKRSALANKPGVTPEMIRYHVSTAENLRLAIFRIEHTWAIPRGWQPPAEESPEVPETPQPEEVLPAPEPPPQWAVDAWDQAREDVRAAMPPNHFGSWVKPVRLARVDGRQFTGGAYSTFGQEWLEKHDIGPLIAESLGKILGEPVTVAFAVI